MELNCFYILNRVCKVCHELSNIQKEISEETYKVFIYVNKHRDELSLSVRVYIRGLAAQFLRYHSETVHTYTKFANATISKQIVLIGTL